MAAFKRGDVVKFPFPYTDKNSRQSRPALVVSAGSLEEAHGLLWVLMITSAENRGWPGDVDVSKLTAAGLPCASVIRTAKVATIDAADATRLGKISAATLKQVTQRIGEMVGLATPRTA